MFIPIRSTLAGLVLASLAAVPVTGAQQSATSAFTGAAASDSASGSSSGSAQADSAYQAARRALDGGEYRQAAELFSRVAERFPRTTQAADALYWRAFALFRSGSGGNLSAALSALADLERRYPSSPAFRNDAGPLRIRICGALAARGDAGCAADVAAAAAPQGQTRSCPSEDDENDERIMAMNALMNMNSDAAVPILERTLARRDECSRGLRKKAVFVISQKRSGNVVDILLRVAREDPAIDVREQAIFWLGNVRDERVVDLLADLVSSSSEPSIQEKAIFALSNSRSEKASQVLRDLAQRDNAPRTAREQAIFWLGNRRDASSGEFLRALYARLTDRDLKDRVLFSIANQRGADNGQWLLGIALNDREPMDLRKNALFHAGNQRAASVADMAGLYDRITEKQMKEQVIFTLSQRREPEAVDKLMSIAEKDTDREMRSKAIFWLGQSRDPRVLRFLEALINK